MKARNSSGKGEGRREKARQEKEEKRGRGRWILFDNLVWPNTKKGGLGTQKKDGKKR